MSLQTCKYLDISIPVSGGMGSAQHNIIGRITRARFEPPSGSPGNFQAHVQDEIDGVFSIPEDPAAVVMNGATSVAIKRGEVAGVCIFFITNTTLTGIFKLRIWGYFGVYA